MYVTPLFKEEDAPVLHDAIRQSGLATLVTLGAEAVSSLPVKKEADLGEPCDHDG
jgi:predicted FMN-binding regulatory protein PaiB